MTEGSRWYVVHTQPRGEATALRHLKRQGFTAFLPEYRRRRRHARRVDWVRAPLFPRYMFVAMDMASARWRAIASTIGVSHLVCNGDEPAPVPEGVVEDIRARVGADGLVKLAPRNPFRPGDAVRVLVGALADQIGFFQCATDEDRVVLLLDMLGRRVSIKLPLADVAPAT
jgi:transcriptional antiterminator RfaH